MAATTVKPYPHVQINVKDNSIATINFVETLPVHRALYVMRTQKGPLGEPTWCNTYSEAAALFGAETFNPANKEYYTRASAFLKETMTRNGAFITRYLPDGCKKATLVLEATVALKESIQQYKHSSDGSFEVYFDDQESRIIPGKYKASREKYAEANTDYPGDGITTRSEYAEVDADGNPIPIYDGNATNEWLKTPAKVANSTDPLTEEGISITYTVRALTAKELNTISNGKKLAVKRAASKITFPIAVFRAAYEGNYGNDLAVKLFYTSKSNNAGDTDVYNTVFYQIGFAEREYNSTTWNAIPDIYGRDNVAFAANPEAINKDSGSPLSVDYVLDKSFSDKAHQLPVDFDIYENNINEVGLIIAAFEGDVYYEKEEIVNGILKPVGLDPAGLNCYGQESALIGALSSTAIAIVKEAFKKDGIAKDFDVSSITFKNTDDSKRFSELLSKLADGKKLTLEQALSAIEDDTYDPKTFGYRVNIFSATNMNDVEYDHVVLADESKISTSVTETKDGESLKITTVNPSYNYQIPLIGGKDGEFVDPEGPVKTKAGKPASGNEPAVPAVDGWSSDDKAMYQFCKLKLAGTGDRIVESLRYPFTHIFDLGFSIKTKKAMCDFLDIRDDVVVILSSVVLYSDGSGSSLSFFNELDTPGDAQAKDEANTETLRSYALLMRESVLYGTDCMRCSIYNHAGVLANGSFNGIMPFTYWVAVQYAQYGNLTYMNQQEPRGLPNSYNLLFKKWSWNNYRADSQSRVWDAGANYVQYADMTRLFYPSLRTVYRAATSVLVDEWFVAAVVYTKYVCRRAWATFSGRNDSAAVLQGAIKTYLDKELKALYNGKYTFDVTVYQTAEEQQLGYIQHVKLSITAPATMRVLDVDIEVNRENFVPEE